MKRQKETRYQVVLDALAISTCSLAFLIMAEVPVIYMHQFWHTFSKHGSSYRFKIDNKKFIMIMEEFGDILNMCPRIEGQEFFDPSYEEEALSFIRHLCYTGEIKYLTDVTVDHLHQPWRTFSSIINKYLSSKDLAYQIENKDAKKSDKMYCPRFTKFIIDHYLTRNSSISRRNRMFIHTTKDDIKLGILKFVSNYENIQVYSALIPKEMTNAKMLEYESFKTYYAIPTLATRRNKKDYHISQASGLASGTYEWTGALPGVPVVPKFDLEGEIEYYGNSGDKDEDDDEEGKKDDDDDSDENVDDDDEMTELDSDEEDIYLDERILTIKFHEEEDKEDYDDLYGDFNVNLIIEDIEKTNAD
uniref:Uncharacterized protein n=1 Tax=Tanacetum cinerariifolium TaxID=118510 RepID=A0A6L2JEX1_TANCI|nr:hypothetical protein [Tanacetum cinerariifolium]